MGYSYYTLPDGREAGYAVEAECDHPDCREQIDRGMAYLCGRNPLGHKDDDEPGCGNYYCGAHEYHHACPRPECGEYAADDNLVCGLIHGHELPHQDPYTLETFTRTEQDLVDEEAA